MEPRRRFRFLKQLSEGTFGRVYMAEMVTDNNFSSVVAIKLLHGKWLGHEEIVRRSRDEARVLGLLHHRNIIRVEDLTSINSQCAVIMEYLNGVDLKSLINYFASIHRDIPYKIVFEVMSAGVSALEAAYYRPPLRGGEPLRLIHRDIKPSNIMLTSEGDVKVLDFGTAQARFEDREAETQALSFGSQAYMAPERLLGDPDAPSGDIFSVGVTLYELLALESFGKIHIRPEKHDEAIRERVEGLPLQDLPTELAQDVRDLLYGLLTYDATQRPDAQQTLDMMEDIVEKVHDASLRRFCREMVSKVQEHGHESSHQDDPLAGSTLFEDVSSFTAKTAEPGLSSSPTMAFEPPMPDPANSAPLTPPPPVAPQLFADPSSFPVPVKTAFTPISASMVAAANDSASVTLLSEELPVPSKKIRRTVTPVIRPVDTQTSVRPKPQPAPESLPPPSDKGGGSLRLALGLLGLLGFFAIGAVLILPMLTSPPPPVVPDTPVIEEPVVLELEGIPGQRLEHGALGPDTGTIILRLKGGRASVKLNASIGDFEQIWDGSGELEIVGLPLGTYVTRIKSAEGTDRSTVESISEKVCTYTFTVGGGSEEWNRDCQ